MKLFSSCNKICRRAPFTIYKIDSASGTEIPGAVFELIACDGLTFRGTTGSNGLLVFHISICTNYTLREAAAPAGYAPSAHVYNVCADAGGRLFVDGTLTTRLIIGDTPIPAPSGEFIFRKLDESTGLPLAGATFTLTQNGTIIGTAASGPDGIVNFGILAAGTYQLTETSTPPGYQPNISVYQVAVAADGSITVDGVPLDAFVLEDIPIAVSAPPTIDTILADATVITGSGIPGSSIVVTLPNGATVTTTVNAGGTWTANVPAGTDLVAGDMVSANQTEPGKLISGDVHTIVIGNADFEPGIDVYVENLSTGLNYAQAGDVLLYDFIISNSGAASSVWPAAYATFYLSNYVTLQENSIRINNRTVTSSQYNYDSTANTLTVYLGDIAGGTNVGVSYRVTVNSDVSDINEIILNVLLGSLV